MGVGGIGVGGRGETLFCAPGEDALPGWGGDFDFSVGVGFGVRGARVACS